MYQPSGLGTNRPRRKHHAHILRITVRHHMPLVSTEDLIWPIEALAHIDGLDFCGYRPNPDASLGGSIKAPCPLPPLCFKVIFSK